VCIVSFNSFERLELVVEQFHETIWNFYWLVLLLSQLQY